MRLLAIGLAAGFFGALFGVGGGIIMVPLLILWCGYSERPAMDAALVGVPAAFGAVAGAAIQQRLANRTLSLAFAGLLVAVAARLLL